MKENTKGVCFKISLVLTTDWLSKWGRFSSVTHNQLYSHSQTSLSITPSSSNMLAGSCGKKIISDTVQYLWFCINTLTWRSLWCSTEETQWLFGQNGRRESLSWSNLNSLRKCYRYHNITQQLDGNSIECIDTHTYMLYTHIKNTGVFNAFTYTNLWIMHIQLYCNAYS